MCNAKKRWSRDYNKIENKSVIKFILVDNKDQYQQIKNKLFITKNIFICFLNKHHYVKIVFVQYL